MLGMMIRIAKTLSDCALEWSATDSQARLIVLGVLGAAWGAVVNYFFESSADSGCKTGLRAHLLTISHLCGNACCN